jgi:ABC-2 type transport system ATP-binding protein
MLDLPAAAADNTNNPNPRHRKESAGATSNLQPREEVEESGGATSNLQRREEVEAVCTRAIIIARGRILFDGSPADLQKEGPLDEVFRRITTGERVAVA